MRDYRIRTVHVYSQSALGGEPRGLCRLFRPTGPLVTSLFVHSSSPSVRVSFNSTQTGVRTQSWRTFARI